MADEQVLAPQAPEQEQTINMVDPEGNLGSVPVSQAQQAAALGYSQADPSQVAQYFKEQKFGTLPEELKTLGEGALQGALGPVGPAIEQVFGAKPENIRARAEVNPGLHATGEIGTLAGGALTGTGEGAILSKLGEGAEALTGLGEGASTVAKIGSSAVKGAVENLAYQAGDEASKMVLKDPDQTAQTAIADMGLASLIGGGVGAGLGAVSPLWKAAQGSKVGSFLKGVSDRMGGVDGIVPDAVSDAIQSTGMEVAPEVRAAMSDNPYYRQAFQELNESSTSSGVKAQEALRGFKKSAGDALVASLGKSPEEVDALSHMSDYEAGESLKKTLIDSLKQTIDPISDQFDKVKGRFSSTELPQVDKADIATKVGELASNEGYNLSPSSPQAKAIARVMDELPNLKTLEDLRKYTSVIGDNTSNPELWRVGSQLKKIFRSSEESVLDRAIGAEAPELLEQHAAARGAYKAAMESVDALNDRLHVGRYAGPSSFMKALKDMAPEDVLRRLSPKGDAGIIGELSQRYPQVAEQLKNYHVDQIIKQAASKAAPGETVNVKNLLTSLEKMSPEMRQFVLPEGAHVKIDAISSLLDALPSKLNTSGTAKALDALMGKVPSSAVGWATILTGHSPAAAAVLGLVTKLINRDIPDAAKLAMLKFLGSNKEISVSGFKAMTDYIHHAIQGENLTGRAVKSIFKSGKEVLPQYLMPSETDRKKLDRALKTYQQEPQKMFDIGGHTAHYLPEHGTSIGQVAGNAINMLNGMRPESKQPNPLDTKIKPSAAAKAQWENVLNLAQQPLYILHKLKNNTMTPQDVGMIQNLYPQLYQKLSHKMIDAVTDAVGKGETIPYKTRLGISLFLAQPMDSTMTPQGIMAAQPAPEAPPPQPGEPRQKHSMTALNKMPGMYQTNGQAAEEDRRRT